jgi:hypothetical protein
MSDLPFDLEIQIIHRAHHRGWERDKTKRFMSWLEQKRKVAGLD